MMKKDAYVFWQWVQQKMEEMGISSFRELERRSNLANGAISTRKNDVKFPTVEMAEGLCRGLGVSWIELWEHAGFVEPQTEDQLTGLDIEIYRALQNAKDSVKRAALETIKVWLVAWEDKD
jgi:transcriptional regulator with XRE-family HTH domain